ncbi:MAG: flavodoxin family protein [bacterium]
MSEDRMRKILGVVGSPRRNGNTHILVSTILEGAAAHGAATEVLFLDDLEIKECDGCHACWRGKGCSKQDDMNTLYPRIIEADALVFGTPVYWYGPTALMKGFVDRFVYFNCPENHAGIRGKRAAIAVPYEEEGAEMAGPVVVFFEKSLAYLEMDLVGKVLVPGVGGKGDVLKKPASLAQARVLGERLVIG